MSTHCRHQSSFRSQHRWATRFYTKTGNALWTEAFRSKGRSGKMQVCRCQQQHPEYLLCNLRCACVCTSVSKGTRTICLSGNADTYWQQATAKLFAQDTFNSHLITHPGCLVPTVLKLILRHLQYKHFCCITFSQINFFFQSRYLKRCQSSPSWNIEHQRRS